MNQKFKLMILMMNWNLMKKLKNKFQKMKIFKLKMILKFQNKIKKQKLIKIINNNKIYKHLKMKIVREFIQLYKKI